jgi:hypothetical protein
MDSRNPIWTNPRKVSPEKVKWIKKQKKIVANVVPTIKVRFK